MANAACANYNEVIERLGTRTSADRFTGFKTGNAPEVAGVFHFLSQAGYPTTATGVIFPNCTPAVRQLAKVTLNATASGLFILYDKLSSVTGISVATTGSKTVTTPALTRYTDGAGVLAMLEVTTATTAAATVNHNSYTDNDGNTGQSGASIAFPAAATNVQTGILLPLAAGDTGVRAVATINVSVLGTGGVVACHLIKVIESFSVLANVPRDIDMVLQTASLPVLPDGSDLHWMFVATGTTAPTLSFDLSTIKG